MQISDKLLPFSAITALLLPSPSVFDRLPHAKIKNRNRLFLSETVLGTGWPVWNKRTLRRPCRKRFTASNSSGADCYAGKQEQ